jgi:hypothetical protein
MAEKKGILISQTLIRSANIKYISLHQPNKRDSLKNFITHGIIVLKTENKHMSYNGSLKSSWTHVIIPIRDFVEVR